MEDGGGQEVNTLGDVERRCRNKETCREKAAMGGDSDGKFYPSALQPSRSHLTKAHTHTHIWSKSLSC